MPEHKKETKPLLAHLTDGEAQELCAQLRSDLIQSVSGTGGHLASNLGAVELTVAIHRVFDTSRDRLVFDVGHQCYIHKMITGRREEMSRLRKFGGIAGFPKPNESVHDAFVAGHASNSVAVALGMAQARTLMQDDYHVLALLGDGALSGGLAYEGLSNAGQSKQPMIVILNDNGMSITRSVGGVADHLASQRLKPQYLTFKKCYRKVMNTCWVGRKLYRMTHKVKKALKESLLPSSMFENMGFVYLGPVDGHDLPRLTKILRYARELNEPVLLHVRTVKGKGFAPAEENPDDYHGVSPFDPTVGVAKKNGGENFSSVFGQTMVSLSQKDERVCAITAAMLTGTGLEQYQERYPERCFDVGIAEGCAVSMAAGMAKQGMIPVFAVYSTFLQRAYDMLIHDVALDGLHTVIGVDRAGLVGEDGETHHGVFDVPFLTHIPGMTVFAPASHQELRDMLEQAVLHTQGPVAIRYPRGSEGEFKESYANQGNAVLKEGSDITLIGYGTMINEVLLAARLLEQDGISAQVIKLGRIAPLDMEDIAVGVKKTGAVLVAEDCVSRGSMGEQIARNLAQRGISARVILCNTGDQFTTHGSVSQLRQMLGLDGEGLRNKVKEALRHG